MKNNQDLENKIERALNSIDVIERATPSPFFYSKVVAKMTRKKSRGWVRFVSYINQPAIAFATICLVLIINITAVFYNASEISSTPVEANELAVADDEYNDASSFYDLENPNPNDKYNKK